MGNQKSNLKSKSKIDEPMVNHKQSDITEKIRKEAENLEKMKKEVEDLDKKKEQPSNQYSQEQTASKAKQPP